MPSKGSTLPGNPKLTGRRVLLIEDDWFIADALASLLNGEGLEIVGPAATLDDASRLIGTTAVDAAVVDLNLGGVMADPIVEQLTLSGVPVIVVSAYDTHPFVESVYATLQKPVAATALIRALVGATQGTEPSQQQI
ncbi:MAG: response regulator [Hyphomicrobiaceae bacterium]|nr:response regulator [Hyphomicrobiaceae bacterium]